MKESEATLSDSLSNWWGRVSGGQPNMDWIMTGSTPISSDDSDMVAQNSITRQHADTYGLYYLDLYNLFGASWSLANDLGFMSDGVHRNNAGNIFAASCYLRSLGLFDHPYGIIPYGMSSAKGITSSTKLALAFSDGLARAGYGDLLALRERAGSSGQDSEFVLNRSVFFRGPSGGVMEVNPDGVGNSGVGYLIAPPVVGLGASADTFLVRLSAGGVTVNTTKTTNRGIPGYIYASFWAYEGGSAASPCFTFQDAQNKGFYPVTDGVGVSVGGSQVGQWMAGKWTWGTSGPTNTYGSGAPSASEPNGSTYQRTDGTGPNFYVRENGAWVAK